MFNINLKPLVAGVALAVTAAVAHADINPYSSGNGELFFNIVDPNGSPVSFFLDLSPVAGATLGSGTFALNDFLPSGAAAVAGAPAPGTVTAPGTRYSWIINNSTPGWSDFRTTAGIEDIGSWRWNVAGGDSLGSTAGSATETHRYVSTTQAPIGTVQTQSRTNLIAFNTTEAYITNVNAVDGGLADGSGNVVGPAATGYFGQGFQPNWLGKAVFDSTAEVGDSQNFYYMFIRPATNAGVIQYGNAIGAASWTFERLNENDFELTYAAPVPEPEQWAMMAAGLALVGALAKRRRKA